MILFLTGNSWPQKISLSFSFLKKNDHLQAVVDGIMRVQNNEWAAGTGGFLACTMWIQHSCTYSGALKWISRCRKGQVPCELYHPLLTSSSSILLVCSLLVLHLSLSSKSFPLPRHTSWCVHLLAESLTYARIWGKRVEMMQRNVSNQFLFCFAITHTQQRKQHCI